MFQDALEAVLGCRPDIKGCSRTDAGVHALGFMLNFHADTRIPAAKLPLALNRHLPPDIRALEARVVPDDFHARYAAHTKTYLYRIHNSPIDSPFAARYYTKVPGSILWESTISSPSAPRAARLRLTATPCAPSRPVTFSAGATTSTSR